MLKLIKKISILKLELIFSLILFFLFLMAYPVVSKYFNEDVPLADWFEVKQLYINPEIHKSDEITIIYDRIIRQKFDADWIVELQKINEDGTIVSVCGGKGSAAYDPSKVLPTSKPEKIGVTLAWFMGNENCQYDSGTYRIYVKWSIDRGEYYYITDYEKISNPFEIS